jgi:glycosyltransferase involved in cell wall biosynthesis
MVDESTRSFTEIHGAQGEVLALARDEELRRRLGENARRMMEQHTWEKRCDELGDLYSRLIVK